jgi:hypothetical protein
MVNDRRQEAQGTQLNSRPFLLRTRDNGSVTYVPRGFVDEAKLFSRVKRAEKALAKDVVRVRHDLGSDWMGSPAVFFNIVLKDEASRPENLREVAQRVALRIMNEAKTDESGLHAYFNFRSESEDAKMKPAWA